MQRLCIFTNTDLHGKLCAWHESLYEHRGIRATLRRATSPVDVMFTEGYQQLLSILGSMPLSSDDEHWLDVTMQNRNGGDDIYAVATIAGISAHVKQHTNNSSFAGQLGSAKEKGGKTPHMSPLRFQRLQKSRSWDELYVNLLRAVKMLGSVANIISLADDVFLWVRHRRQVEDEPEKRLLVRWATDYYTATNKLK